MLEGGSIDVNGEGTLLTTEECLLSPIQARNPGVAREDLERVMGEHLGVRKVLWLGNGIAGDDTHGHVDDLARFVDERTVVLAEETDPGDENFAHLAENRMRLESMTNADGERLRVDRAADAGAAAARRRPAAGELRELLHRQPRRAGADVQRPATTAGRCRSWRELFPGRRVVGIHAVDLVWGWARSTA